MRIAKAMREGRHHKVKSLQWLLTHSRSAKLLAIRRVTSNKGCQTAGIDGVTWRSSTSKIKALSQLRRKGYRSSPLRRIIIPKRNGKQRPLGIPTMRDRAMQALYRLALEPLAEVKADPHAYGFRPKRSCADAIEQCFKVLCRQNSSQWILEGDITACFDTISHTWLMDNIPLDKKVLRQWLKAGYIAQCQRFATEEGTPQGGIISPTLALMTLSGLEATVKHGFRKPDKVNIVTYADDFIMTAQSQETLEHIIIPRVESFLHERGLTLSKEKTKITSIHDGFNFLGFNLRKYNNTLLIKPAKENFHTLLKEIRHCVKANKTAKTESLIRLLNPKIRGWVNYYRHVVAKRTFQTLEHELYEILQRWIRRRHIHQSGFWRVKKYFRTKGTNNWVFFAKVKEDKGLNIFP